MKIEITSWTFNRRKNRFCVSFEHENEDHWVEIESKDISPELWDGLMSFLNSKKYDQVVYLLEEAIWQSKKLRYTPDMTSRTYKHELTLVDGSTVDFYTKNTPTFDFTQYPSIRLQDGTVLNTSSIMSSEMVRYHEYGEPDYAARFVWGMMTVLAVVTFVVLVF